jgi:glyoxylase I family protein
MASQIPFCYHGLDHVVLKVTTIEASLHFYRQVLGMHLERIIDDYGIYQLRCGRSLIDLQVLPAGIVLAEQAARGVGHVCVLVDGDMSDILEHLATHGVAIDAGPQELYGATGFGTSIYLRDPDGHSLELKVDHCDFAVRPSVHGHSDGLSRPPSKAHA